MGDNIYDNGTTVLGVVRYVKEYIIKNTEEISEVNDLLDDLKELDNDTIVAINYDTGMGYSVDYWHTIKDLIKRF
jgi:hypothetical protein